jgi:4-hydroxy-2-oxoheptanedioate aldolase
MRANRLRDIVRQGGVVVDAWLTIPSSFAAEAMAHQGFDAVTIDTQHGLIGFETAVAMLQAISTTDAVPMARVAANDPAAIMQLLDAGAYGIICPMISSADEARVFAAACRYPPRGTRSFGPSRGQFYGGADYIARADDEIITLAMIETTGGIASIDAILALPEIDGIFIGPNDLSLALGRKPASESDDPLVSETIRAIAAKARAASKIAAIFCSGGAGAKRRIGEGFNFVVPGGDLGHMLRSAQAAIATARSATSTRSATSKSPDA